MQTLVSNLSGFDPGQGGQRSHYGTITARELWAVIHGMLLGSLFLLAYAGGLAELIPRVLEWATEAGDCQKGAPHYRRNLDYGGGGLAHGPHRHLYRATPGTGLNPRKELI